MTVIVMGVVMSMFVRMRDLLMNMIVRVFLIRTLRLEAWRMRMPMVGIVMRMRMRVRHLVVPMRMRMIGHNSRIVLLFSDFRHSNSQRAHLRFGSELQ